MVHPTMAHFLTLEIEPVIAATGPVKGFLIRPDGDPDREYAVTESSPCLWRCCQRMIEEFDTTAGPSAETEGALHGALHRLIAAPRFGSGDGSPGDSLPVEPEGIQAITDDLFDTFGDTLPGHGNPTGRATTASVPVEEGGAGAVAFRSTPQDHEDARDALFDSIPAPDFGAAIEVVLDDVPEPEATAVDKDDLPFLKHHRTLRLRMVQMGLRDDERLALMSEAVGRPVDSTKRLGPAECIRVHNYLSDWIKQGKKGSGVFHWNSLQGRADGPLHG